MGDLIELKPARNGGWDDVGEPEPDPPEPPRPRLLMLPILAFLDVMAIVVGLVCRPFGTGLLLIGICAVWDGLRDGLGLGPGIALGLFLPPWLIAHFMGRDVDGFLRLVERGEAALLRLPGARRGPIRFVLHPLLYSAAAAIPVVTLALVTRLVAPPAFLPPSLVTPWWLGVDDPVPVIGIAVFLGLAALLHRYRWHPVAAYLDPFGGRRSLRVAAKGTPRRR